MIKHLINSKCTLCNACLPLCPTGSISVGIKQLVINADTCHGCGVCVSVCPESAIAPLEESTPPPPDPNKEETKK